MSLYYHIAKLYLLSIIFSQLPTSKYYAKKPNCLTDQFKKTILLTKKIKINIITYNHKIYIVCSINELVFLR